VNSVLKIMTLTVVIGGALAAGCGERKTMSPSTSTQAQSTQQITPTAEQWQRVAQLHILFGHQSVGSNILSGVQTLASEQQVPLRIAESQEVLAAPGLQHFKVGRNEDPEGKLADFRAALTKNTAAPLDVALLKLCYIDFKPTLDSSQLAQHYIALFDELGRSHPNTVFVPMTSPLTTVQTGPRAWLKKLLGKEVGGYASNARRHVFNQALRAHFGTGKQLFDVAALESNRGQSGVDYRGERIESLDPHLASDDGHLNSAGERLLGGALIAHLASVGKLQ
jgi:hypothetical protein